MALQVAVEVARVLTTVSLQQKCDLTVGALLPQLSKSGPEPAEDRVLDRTPSGSDLPTRGLRPCARGGPVHVIVLVAIFRPDLYRKNQHTYLRPLASKRRPGSSCRRADAPQ